MNYCLILFMFLAHIVDDFYLQGKLISLKQKKWWEESVKDLDSSIYKNDYIIALLIHGLCWSIMVTIPIIVFRDFEVSVYLYLAVIVNGLIHSYIDNLKANSFKINLVTDQSIHFIQVIVMYFLGYYIGI